LIVIFVALLIVGALGLQMTDIEINFIKGQRFDQLNELSENFPDLQRLRPIEPGEDQREKPPGKPFGFGAFGSSSCDGKVISGYAASSV